MKKLLVASLATVLLLFVGCQNERVAELADRTEVQNTDSESRGEVITPIGLAYAGQMIVKLNEATADGFKLQGIGEVEMNSVPTPMSKALAGIKATNMSRLFPPAGKYEARSRKEGMHLWYIIDFEDDVDLSMALTRMSKVEGVELVESVPVIELLSANDPTDLLAPPTPATFPRKDDLPFNDPRLGQQWHYNNMGTVNGGVMGCDVNLFKAWEITTGSRDVIVCVVDGGIDVTHEDLKDNLWVNEAELNGTDGVDDDGNGYVDDIHGYCFVKNAGDVYPDDDAHGTHVAGTVAARNNNGIGVAGVAGGDGTPNSGIRLQSAAIFRDGYRTGGNSAAAIKYGADNGAVISQNSWGYKYESNIREIPPYIKAAVDYFNKYAGTDENGNQLPDSPMKGGLVIFAAGNDDREFDSQPSAYEGVLAVSAIGPDFKKASYSTYGEWVDIAAPGGDQDRYGNRSGVLSTLARSVTGVDYGFYQGTSMACPHVSGVAALVASKFGGPGFTGTQLRQRLLATVMPLDINQQNPRYVGKLGIGYVDAYRALSEVNKEIAPEAPIFDMERTNQTDFTSITVVWTVPKDEDDGAPVMYQLYYSTEPLDANNYSKKGILVGPKNGYITGFGLEEGDPMSWTIDNLEQDTKYYLALVAFDRWGLSSKPAINHTTTKKNTPPEITNMIDKPIVVLDILGPVTNEFNVIDIDDHSWTYTISGDTQGVTHKKTEKGIQITIRPVLSEGDHSFTIAFKDELGAVREYEIPFRIITVKAPVLRSQIPAQLIGIKNDPVVINLNDYFEPQEYLPFEYSAVASDGTLLAATIDADGKLKLKGFKPGQTVVTLDVTNGHMNTRTTFNVTVVDDASKDVYSVWPLPIKNDLNIWVNPKYNNATVKLINVNGEVVYDKNLTTDNAGIAVANMRKVAPGSYTLRIEAGQSPYVKSVLKR